MNSFSYVFFFQNTKGIFFYFGLFTFFLTKKKRSILYVTKRNNQSFIKMHNFLHNIHRLNNHAIIHKHIKSVTRSLSLLPKLNFDKHHWPSLLPSNKNTVDLIQLETTLYESGVKYVMPSFVDMHGIPKCKMVPLSHLYSCSQGSELFTGAAVDGIPQAISDDEVCAVGDPTSLTAILPYRRDVCYMPASLYYHGIPFDACSRNIYSRVAEKVKRKKKK